jgi:hypothetical protein
MTTARGAVRALLDAALREPRVHSLEAAAARIAARPLADTLLDLDAVLASPVTGEDCRRLHVLVSSLYHRAGAPLTLTQELQAAIEAARTSAREEVPDELSH